MVQISKEYFAELIRAEGEAEALKGFFAKKHKEYDTISRDEIKMVVALYGVEVEG